MEKRSVQIVDNSKVTPGGEFGVLGRHLDKRGINYTPYSSVGSLPHAAWRDFRLDYNSFREALTAVNSANYTGNISPGLGPYSRGAEGVVIADEEMNYALRIPAPTWREQGEKLSQWQERQLQKSQKNWFLSQILSDVPGVVNVHQVGRLTQVDPATGERTAADLPVEIMDYVPFAFDISDLINKSKQDKYGYLVSLAETIVQMHERGVIHGDLKPDNIRIGDDGLPVLIDLGEAFCLDVNGSEWTGRANPWYVSMAEVYGSSNFDSRRFDIYSLLVIGYQLLAGVAHPRNVYMRGMRDERGLDIRVNLDQWLASLPTTSGVKFDADKCPGLSELTEAEIDFFEEAMSPVYGAQYWGDANKVAEKLAQLAAGSAS